MSTLPTAETQYLGMASTAEQPAVSSSALTRGSAAKKPIVKRSLAKCIGMAMPEIKISVGFILIAMSLAYLWLAQQDKVAMWSASYLVPLWLALFALVAFTPPLIFNFRSTHVHWGTLSALISIAWRSTFSTAALIFLMVSRTGEDFLLSSGLVACYFPLLLLQSWLLTRQFKRLGMNASETLQSS